MQQVDEQDAPTGFYAVHSHNASCKGCAFEHIDVFSCGIKTCYATHRKDGLNVVYKPYEFRKLREAVDVIHWLVADMEGAHTKAENFLKKYSEENNE